jgi:cell wall-associated NlpC family hydrolase
VQRLVAIALAAVGLTALAAGAAGARTFAVLDPTRGGLPSYEVPNLPGSTQMPLALSTPPTTRQELSFQDLVEIWHRAGEAYGVPWQILASINKIESNFGRNMGPSSAGAVGWMQFLPSTWERWGVDGDGDGLADPWNATDAVYAAARYLAATGIHTDLRRAVFAYNHSDAYVDDVISTARIFDPAELPEGPIGDPANRVFSLDPLQRRIDRVKGRMVVTKRRIARIERRVERLEWSALRIAKRAGAPNVSDAEFARLEDEAARVERERLEAETRIEGAQGALATALGELEGLEEQAGAITDDQRGTTLSPAFSRLLPPAPTPEAGRVIDWALKQLGIPYLWGGHHGYSLEQMMIQEPSIWNGGFDCSSLVAWAFAKGAGIYIGGWTGSQWEYGATHPDAIRGPGPAQGGADPPGGYRPGDLIFFNDTSHVALYLGNDLFVHAPHTGDVVRIAQLTGYRPVWGWVRWEQVGGPTDLGAGEIVAEPAPDGPVFSVVEA